MKNWTVPAGIGVPGVMGATVAMNVIGWPYWGEATDEETCVVVVGRMGVMVSVPATLVIE